MAKNNNSFRGKNILDNRVEAYSEILIKKYDYERSIGKSPMFGNYYYPAMVSSCADSSLSTICDGFASKPYIKEYRLTKLSNEIVSTFKLARMEYAALKSHSHYSFPIGQCAEQHAANELLFYVKKTNRTFYDGMAVKRDIYFSKAIRPSTGEVFDYCQNCKELFDL